MISRIIGVTKITVSFSKSTMLLLLLLLTCASCSNEKLPATTSETTSEAIQVIERDTVRSRPPRLSSSCDTHGGKAGDSGLKVWCWGDIDIPDYSSSKGVGFSQGQLKIDSECYEKQVTKQGAELRFHVAPTNPGVGRWCSRDFNMRAEIRTAPWNVRHAKGTEEWFGWSYRFGDNYEIDQDNQWKFFQVHPGIAGESPQIGLEIINENQFKGHGAGEIYVTNATTSQKYVPTGIIPKAGETLRLVVRVIWGDASNGLLQVWINGDKIYDKQVSTIYSKYPWGGNAKWGIYKWPWTNGDRVQKSRRQGLTHLETFMGPLRVITRRPGDVDYGKDSYAEVVPN